MRTAHIFKENAMCLNPIKCYILNKQLMLEQNYRKLTNNKNIPINIQELYRQKAIEITNKDYEELENNNFYLTKSKKGTWNYKQIQQAHKIKRIVWNSSKKDLKYSQCYELKEINCGKCAECISQRCKNWSIRCEIEAKFWGKENCCFITLTYNNENLPQDRGLHKKHVQDFLKRLRKKHQGIKEWTDPKDKKICKPIRYFLCGEVGKRTLRPHYHAIIFNWRPTDLKIYKTNEYNQYLYTSKELEELWGKGFVVIGNVDFESCGYVAQYCLKKCNNAFVARQGEQEFITMSRKNGIGCMALNNRNIEDFTIITKKGVFELPRYFKKKINEKNEQENIKKLDKKYTEIGIIEIENKKRTCYKLEDNTTKFDIYNKFEKFNNEHKENIAEYKNKMLEQTSDNEEQYKNKQAEILLKNINRKKRNIC